MTTKHRLPLYACLPLLFALGVLLPESVSAQDNQGRVRASLEQALWFFTSLRIQGGWPMAWSLDLSRHWGQDDVIDRDHITVQPPATPSVGAAYLRVYRVTGDPLGLRVAREAADVLAAGQLAVGGWSYEIFLGPDGPEDAYFLKDLGDPEMADLPNRATMDDDVTQSAVRFMVAIHRETGDERYGISARAGLDFLMKSQYPPGGWPQAFPPREGHYQAHYTLNDGTTTDCIGTLLDAYLTYGDARYLEAAEQGGEWLISAQVSEAQAGWAQQYDVATMKPAWARWFEPPAVCSAVTTRVMDTLMRLYLETGKARYLEPIPAAIAWLERSEISDGRWARFYELGSNRPIYVDEDRNVTHSPINARAGYSWQGGYGVRSRIAAYRDLIRLGGDAYRQLRATLTDAQRERMERDALYRAESLDMYGRWPRADRIHCSDFVNAVDDMLDYLALFNPPEPEAQRADFDGDGDVDFGDLLIFARAFGGTATRFDLDGNGRVGFSDFLLFARAISGGRGG